MAHDFSHLVDAAWSTGWVTQEQSKEVATAILSSLTPSDLADLLAEKCPGWVAIPTKWTEKMEKAAQDVVNMGYKTTVVYAAVMAAAPKLGDE